jgi:hypothetical protein
MTALDNSNQSGASYDNQVGSGYFIWAMNPGPHGLVLHSISFNATEAGALIDSHTFGLSTAVFMSPNEVETWNVNPLDTGGDVQVTNAQFEHSQCKITGWS